jgi:subtilisin
MAMQMVESNRAVILLEFPAGAEAADRLAEGNRQRWSRESYSAARATASDLETDEAQERASLETPDQMINEVLQRLAGNSDMRRAMAMDGREPAPEQVTYMTPADIAASGIGPAPNSAIVIKELGIMSVPAPEGRLQAVESAIQGAPGVKGVEPEVEYRAVATLLTEEQRELEALGVPFEELYRETEERDREWLEATLEAGLADETPPWGVKRVHAPRAWALGFLGQGIRVAVVDTGVGPHIDLLLPVASATFVPGTLSANDDQGHGTHVAGTIAARHNGQGVIGVAPRAEVMRAKVLDRDGNGQSSWVAAGIVWAANNGARIINRSLSGGFSTTIQRALVFARERRVAICAAAGNPSSPTVCQPLGYPGSDPLCMGIAATDQFDHKATFSACGPELDLAAPGVNILSTFPGNAYRALNGTSMATPHVAGVAALVLSKAPGTDPSRLQRHLERTAIQLGSLNQFGHGLVQADTAITTPIPGMVLGAARNGAAAEERAERVLAGAGAGQRR